MNSNEAIYKLRSGTMSARRYIVRCIIKIRILAFMYSKSDHPRCTDPNLSSLFRFLSVIYCQLVIYSVFLLLGTLFHPVCIYNYFLLFNNKCCSLKSLANKNNSFVSVEFILIREKP